MYGQEQVPLTNFAHLESAKVVVSHALSGRVDG